MSNRIVLDLGNGRRRVRHPGGVRGPGGKLVTRTNREAARELEINNIVGMYRKAGLALPQVSDELFADVAAMPKDFAGVFELRERVADSFSQLPADVREWLRNDPANLSHLMTEAGRAELLDAFPHYKKSEAAPPIDGGPGAVGPEPSSSKTGKSAAKQTRQKESSQDSDGSDS